MNLPRFSVKNPVAVNLLMWLIIAGGIYYWLTLVREFFPNMEPDQVFVSVPYPGATPEEVEKSVTRRIEREIDDIDGIEEISSQILEGATVVAITLDEGTDVESFLNDLRGEIDKVRPELPVDAEDPEITEVRPFVPVISIVLYGDVSEERIREEARKVRDDLMDLAEISQAVISGIREREIRVEVQPEKLEEFGLTFQLVGAAVAEGNLDVPGGQLKSPLGNIRVRTLGEKDRARQLENLIIRSRPDGSAVRLKDVADVKEAFEDKVEQGRFAGKRACSVTVFKAPEEDALKISSKVKSYVAENSARLSGAIHLTTTTDLSRFISQRLDLMIRNAGFGLILVIIALAFFLNLRVAFWVAFGLPTAFLGTFIVMRVMGVSINLISLFGLIVVLGLIVDDAIVVGERIFTRLRTGEPPLEAAEKGARDVTMPVIAAVLTTVVAFLPLAFMEGRIGAFLGVLPMVVIAALSMSLVECFFILPCHLAHRRAVKEQKSPGVLRRFYDWVGESKHHLLEEAFPRIFKAVLSFTLRWRYATIAAAIGFSMMVAGLVAGGIVPYVLIQDVDAESLSINLEMTSGTPEERTTDVISQLEQIVLNYPEVKSVFSVIGTSFSERGRETAADPATVGQLNIELKPADHREALKMRTSEEIINDMRRKTAGIHGVRKLAFEAHSGGPGGADIVIRVRGDDLPTVARAVAFVRDVLSSYEGVVEIEDDLKIGKREVRLELLESARALGLTTRGLALQIRHAFFGFEAQKIQEEDEEVTVRVLLPEGARKKLSDLSRVRIAAPSGSRIPLDEVAAVSTARGYSSLSRVDGKRTSTIRANIEETRANVSELTSSLTRRLGMLMPSTEGPPPMVQFFQDFKIARSGEPPKEPEAIQGLKERFPGVSITFEGSRKETRESVGSLMIGFPIALFLIYVLIAILFRSYTQPAIIMMAIPYSLVGAVLGHFLMGYPFTILSLIGAVALAGIVVNDSLILVDYVNRLRREGKTTWESVVEGAGTRLRAIVLTSVTTVFGLAPLMLERSFQAQFLIPMAISIVFGVAFATVLTLVVVPCFYLVFEDVRSSLKWLFTGKWTRELPYDPGMEGAVEGAGV